ncbi:hypothetical protein PybrP1_008537 [[Pythium] brassicae (nom. inval.)]|nr:hypothetical protein PybrP1_008537 [[Pythium] brassicae (nom. inval.)]
MRWEPVLSLSFALCIAANDALECNSGAFFDGIKCALCPGGSYGDRSGLTTPLCSGLCAGGYFCPEGSTAARQRICGRSVYYCPPGSATRLSVTDGYYTTMSPTDPAFGSPLSSSRHISRNAAAAQTKCEPGYYCALGIRYPCPAGLFGEVYGLQSASCTGDAACSGLCPAGYYCPVGTCTQVGTKAPFSTVCEPSLCPAGYYCPLASAQPVACGAVDVFCPVGSSTPIFVASGFYTTWTPVATTAGDISIAYLDGNVLAAANRTLRSAQRVCERGAYCVGGVKRLCPAGVYGSTLGLASAACTAPCPAGYFCPVGASDATAHPCSAKYAFCRQGSARPTHVSEGFYTTVAPTTDRRVDQIMCPAGSYCVGGIVTLCPGGTYGSTTGLSTPLCSGRCKDGFLCAAGSTSATPLPCPTGSYCTNGIATLCPAGTYGSTTGLSMPACSGKCRGRFVCAAGSTSPTETPCAAGTYSKNGIRCWACLPGFCCAGECLSREQTPCDASVRNCPLV